MKIFHDIGLWQNHRTTIPHGTSLGVVMTMGALHQGHLSLIQQSKSKNDVTLVTHFINPTQFESLKDYQTYPNSWGEDMALLKETGVDYVLAPSTSQMYAKDDHFKVHESHFSQHLCGLSRLGHFSGVFTVVMKFLQLAQAKHAYFGEKDFQQYYLINKMCEYFFLPTKIICCPTIRDTDGLALSSRNLRLSKNGRCKAGVFAKVFHETECIAQTQQKLLAHNITVDYIDEYYHRRFAAVLIEDVRLIDNFSLPSKANTWLTADSG